MKVAFWNIKDKYGKNIRNCINSLCDEVDLLILAEAYNNVLDTTIPGFTLISPVQVSGRLWIKIFQKTSSAINIQRVTNLFNDRIQIAQVNIPGKKDFYICGLHLSSKVNKDDVTQFQHNHLGVLELHSFFEANHDRAIIVGDFNHNPFESILISKGVLNSIPSRKVISQLNSRTYLRKRRTMFYNPMWNFLGDHDFKSDEQQVNGTYFLKESRLKLSGQIHWNLFDQVMVSQSIVDTLDPSSVKIISEFTNTLTRNRVKMVADSLYNHGSFINSWFSDHLPIFFELDTTKLI